MPKYPYLARAGKRGIWRYRRGVPVKLRPVIGAREILRSLRTPVLAEALARYAEVAADAERQLEKARTELEPGAKPVPSDDATSSDTRSDADVQRSALCTTARATRANVPFATARVLKDPAAFLRGDILPLPMRAEQFYACPSTRSWTTARAPTRSCWPWPIANGLSSGRSCCAPSC